MRKSIAAAVGGLIVPYIIFSLVIGLNESDFRHEMSQGKSLNFDVQKQQQINKPKPKPKPKPKRKQESRPLPSIKPSSVGNSLGGNGLSFGVPLFDEAEFSEIADGGLLDAMDKGPMDKETVDTMPKVLKRAPIVYPEMARRQGVSGFVSMNVLINESGSVEDVEIIEAKPEEMFELMADSNIRRWKFEPATYNGQKVKVWAMQKIVFKLD